MFQVNVVFKKTLTINLQKITKYIDLLSDLKFALKLFAFHYYEQNLLPSHLIL